MKPICDELGLDIEAILKIGVQTTSIDHEIAKTKAEIGAFERDNHPQFPAALDLDQLASVPDLRAAYLFVKSQIDELKDQLSTPQRKYQGYLEKLAAWTAQRIDILGDEPDPRPETIKYFEYQISYLDQELAERLSAARKRRREISKAIFESKKKILDFYSDLKKSVEERLALVRTDDFYVEIDASFILDRTFLSSFLNFIDRRRRGPFQSANDPQQILNVQFSQVDWNDFDSVYSFLEDIIEKMKGKGAEKLSFREQVAEIKEFYDFLFSFNYFSAKYEL